ncbi:MAG: MFS transporter [Eggerthellaceae bacterium]|nr:MFS transporter [Eggerthellaceae bacterium]
MAQDKLWTRTFIVLMGVNFCSALSFYLIMVKIAEFAVDTYGLPQSVAGTTITAYVIAALLTRLFFGGQIDRWGVKRSLAIGTAVNAVAMLLYLVPMGFIPLMAVRIAHGFAFALMSGSAAAGAALVIPRDRYGEGIGYFSMMQALATGIGPFVAIIITNIAGGYAPMFATAAVIAVIALVSVFFITIPPTEKPAVHMHADKQKAGGIASLVQLSVVPLASTLFLVYLGYSGILSFVTSYAAERGLSDAVSLYFVVYAIVILISRPPVGRRVDRKGENSTIYYCFASLVVGFVMLAFAVNGAILLASAAFAGFGIGATQSIVQAVIARDTPPDELGRANSTFFMSMDLGSGIGPILIGAAIPVIGYSASYLALAALAACAALVYFLVHGRK